jgi:hypothetical protein
VFKSITTKQALIGLGVAAFIFRSKFNPIVIDPNIAKRYFNRLLINIVAFRFDTAARKLFLAIKIENPNPKPILLQSLVGKCYLKNEHFGNLAFYQRKEIAPLGNSTFVIEIVLQNPNILNYFMQYMTGNLRGESIVFIGNASINGQILAIKESFSI